MKTLDTHGITYFEKVPSGTEEWYFGISYEHGDLYEAEEVFRAGEPVRGRELCLIHYPDGEIFWPIPKKAGAYSAEPAYYNGNIYLLNVDFLKDQIQILKFDCAERTVSPVETLPLSRIKDCYNLQLNTAPLTLTRQCVGTNEFEIVWPEQTSFRMGDHDSFFLRDGDRLFFNRWYEEGDGSDYRFWEETVICDLNGNELEVLPGDVRVMPNGELWHFH